VKVGDEVMVKVLNIDEKGRINLSRRDALIEVKGIVPENNVSTEQQRPRRPSYDHGHDFHNNHSGYGSRSGYNGHPVQK